jgi:hypothetical protein
MKKCLVIDAPKLLRNILLQMIELINDHQFIFLGRRQCGQ